MAVNLTPLIPVKKYGVPAYKQMLINLLPRGKAWENLGNTFKLLFEAFACELDRIEQRMADLKREAIPGLATTAEMLSDWETAVLLPSEMPLSTDTELQRQLTVHAKVTRQMDYASDEFFIAYASTLGMTITITTLVTPDPFTVGLSTMGTPLAPASARFYWVVNVSADPNSNVNKMIAAFRRLKPAHTAFVVGGVEYMQ